MDYKIEKGHVRSDSLSKYMKFVNSVPREPHRMHRPNLPLPITVAAEAIYTGFCAIEPTVAHVIRLNVSRTHALDKSNSFGIGGSAGGNFVTRG